MQSTVIVMPLIVIVWLSGGVKDNTAPSGRQSCSLEVLKPLYEYRTAWTAAVVAPSAANSSERWPLRFAASRMPVPPNVMSPSIDNVTMMIKTKVRMRTAPPSSGLPSWANVEWSTWPDEADEEYG